MLSGFYTAASGVLMQQRTLNTISNNIANASTPGARSARLVSTTFEQELTTRLETGNTEVIGSQSPVRIVDTVFTDFDMGLVQETGRPFDFAITGDGFFSINLDGSDQIAYSRNGNFDIDNEGYLELRGVGRVLGEGGEIFLGTSDFTVTSDGVIYNSEGNQVDTLRLRVPADYNDLQQVTSGLYFNPNDAQAVDNIDGTPLTVLQGHFENSNIDLNREYTLLMEAQRGFQSCSSALQMIDVINQKTVSQISSL